MPQAHPQRRARLFWSACLIPLALSVSACAGEIYRCEGPGGEVRFSGDPKRCAGAKPHTPDASRLSRGGPASPDPAKPPAAALRGASAVLLDLVGALPDPSDIDPRWDVEVEPMRPTTDTGLREGGLLASVVRRYSKFEGPVSQVCTIEVWQFSGAGQAAAVLANLGVPHWRGEARGPLLVLAHGARLERGARTRHEVGAECGKLFAASLARATATLGGSDPRPD